MNYLEQEKTKLTSRLDEVKTLLAKEVDPELKKMGDEEIISLEAQLAELEQSGIVGVGRDRPAAIRATHGSPLQNDNIDQCFLEIRAGTGGEEATLFAEELTNMYIKCVQLKGWKLTNISNGRNLILRVHGQNCFNILKNESGVHRVQRVPKTEKNGRIHTSTATVAVMPIVPAVAIELNPADLKIDFFRGGGHGGQNVNKVETGVRLTHVPTGVIVECVESRYQYQNRVTAEEMLRSKLYNLMEEQQASSLADIRSSQIGRGMRNEKIKTYNFPQDRLTDHRINKSWHNLEKIMGGEIPLDGPTT